jgi:hypothetical protein
MFDVAAAGAVPGEKALVVADCRRYGRLCDREQLRGRRLPRLSRKNLRNFCELRLPKTVIHIGRPIAFKIDKIVGLNAESPRSR